MEITLFSTLIPDPVRTLVVPIVENTWRACVEKRLEQMLPPGSDQALLADRLANARYALDGKVLAATHDVMALTDATLRLLMPGLPGGMRRSDAATHLASLSQSDLIAHAKALGVNVRSGKSWRKKDAIIEDCMKEFEHDQTHSTFRTSFGTHSQDQQTAAAQALPGSSHRFARLLPSSSCQATVDLDMEEESGQTSAREVEKPLKKQKKRNKATAAYKKMKQRIDKKERPLPRTRKLRSGLIKKEKGLPLTKRLRSGLTV